jgi:GntR family transcriptional regulator
MKPNEGIETRHIFQRLQIQLAQLISNAQPGQRLPAEPDLARQLCVSRATLREAMRSFEGQGLIRRRQGIGTFVVGHPQVIDSGLEVLESIEKLARRIQLEVSMGALRISQLKATAVQAAALQLEEGAPVVQVARVILADKRPVAYLVDLLPEDVVLPEDLQVGFTGSVLDFILEHGRLPLQSSRAEIQAVAASPEIARSLEIQRGDVLLMFTAQLFTSEGRVVDYSLSYFLPGYFRFHVVRRVE